MSELLSDSPCRIDAVDRALLALIGTGDRRAMEQLYLRYFAHLATFFQNTTLRADVVEELINDTMLEVWKPGESIRANVSVLVGISRLAYSRVQKYFADLNAEEPHSRRDLRDCEQSKSMLAKATTSDFQLFLAKLPVKERAAVHLVYAS